jgi:hypothetical protein
MVPRPDRAEVVTMGRLGFPCSAVRCGRGFPRSVPVSLPRAVREAEAVGDRCNRPRPAPDADPSLSRRVRVSLSFTYASSKPCNSRARQNVSCGPGPGDRVFSFSSAGSWGFRSGRRVYTGRFWFAGSCSWR